MINILQVVQLISTKTGEIIKDDRKVFNDTFTDEGYRFPAQKLGSRLFSDVNFPKIMTDTEIGKMTRLSKLMIAKTNMLGYRKNRRIYAYTSNELANIAGLCDKRGKQFINKMLKLKILRKVTSNSITSFYINPAYFMSNGQRLSLDLFLLFRDDLVKILPNWVIDSFVMQARTKKD